MKRPDSKVFEADGQTVTEMLNMASETRVMSGDEGDGRSWDSFTLLRPLGRGGMGEVWRARDRESGTMIAIKILRSELSSDAASTHRFRTEARHMAGLAHPHILKVLRVGEVDGRPFYACPLCRESLASVIARRGAMPESEVLRIASSLADALAYAHGKGITHRDLKPANVLMDDSGHPCLCDFGLMRTVFNDSMIDVQTRTLEGTIAYMSPAAVAGEIEDTRCDIYGWGAILYEMLTGRPPYEAPSTEALLQAVRAGPPRPILAVNPKASRALARVAEGAMARTLRDRYAEMRDILRDLEAIRAGRPPEGPRGASRSRWALAAAVVVVVAAAGAVGARALKNFEPPAQDRRSPPVGRSEQQPQEDGQMKKEALLAVVLATGVMAEAASAEPAAVNAEAVRTSSARVTLVAPYPQPEPGAEPGPRISLQYAVQHLAKQAGYGYLFQESQTRIGDVARLWTTPEIRDMPFDEAIADVLRPHGLAYEISDGKVLLTLRRVTIAPPYPMAYPGAREDQISVQYAVRMIGEQVQLRYDFEASLRNVGESARRWVAPEFRDVPFAEAMRALLNPLGLRYEVVADTIVLVK